MWSKVCYTIIFCHFSQCLAEMIAPGVERTLGDNVKSDGFQVVYGDEDLTIVNQVISDMEQSEMLKPRQRLETALPPLPAGDVKCMMSVDKYCSEHMKKIKNTIVLAIKEDCKSCTNEQKDEAGRVIASMMAHDRAAWKMFLTRSALQILPPKKRQKRDQVLRYQRVGEPEIVENKRNRYIMPGCTVKVKRFKVKVIPTN